MVSPSAQAQSAFRLLNNPEQDGTFTLSFGETRQKSDAGRSSQRQRVSLGFINPIRNRVSLSYGVSFSKATSNNPAATFTTDANSIGGRIGVTVQAGPYGTKLSSVLFANQLSTDLVNAGGATSSDSNSNGIAFAISQPVPLGPRTLSTFEVSYVALPSNDTNAISLKATVYHQLNADWTVFGGWTGHWSDKPVNLDLETHQQSLRLGVAKRINDRITLGFEGRYAVGQRGDDYGVQFGARYTLPKVGK